MLCPQCGAEYREGFATCSSCNAPLIEKPAEETGPQQRKTGGLNIGVLLLIFIIASIIKYYTDVNLLSLYVILPFLALCILAGYLSVKWKRKQSR